MKMGDRFLPSCRRDSGLALRASRPARRGAGPLRPAERRGTWAHAAAARLEQTAMTAELFQHRILDVT